MYTLYSIQLQSQLHFKCNITDHHLIHYATHYAVYIILSVHRTVYTAQCAVYTVQCTVSHCALYSVRHSTLSTVSDVQGTMYNMLFYFDHFVLDTPSSIGCDSNIHIVYYNT